MYAMVVDGYHGILSCCVHSLLLFYEIEWIMGATKKPMTYDLLGMYPEVSGNGMLASLVLE